MRNRSKAFFPPAVLAAVAALILMLSLFAAEKPEDAPNPLATQGLYVGDNASILGPEYVALIDGLCKRLKDATTAEMAVITIKDLGGTTVEDFAERLFRRFGIGVKGKDNGVLVLCSLGDRAVRIEVGYGLEPVLTDAVTSRILDEEAVPFLANNEFGRGLYALTKTATGKIAAAQGITLETSDPASWPVQPAFTLAEAERAGTEAEPADGSPRNAPLILAGLAALWGLLGLGNVYRKYAKARGKAPRARAISRATGVMAILWIGSIVGWIAIMANRVPFGASLVSPVGIAIGLRYFRRKLRRRLENYRLPCSNCGTAMDLTPEDMDDALLAVMDALRKLEDGNLALETPLDPRSGATRLVLDPHEWIHRITAHIPDPGSHCQRFYGAYSNRGRIVCAREQADSPGAGAPAAEAPDNSDFSSEARGTWARLIRKIFSADPLTCACGARMRIRFLITDPRVVDRILRHRESKRCQTRDPFQPRPPPGARPDTLP